MKNRVEANDETGDGYVEVTHGDRRIMIDYISKDNPKRNFGFAMLPKEAKALIVIILGGTT